ncbi:hypothetical protein B0T14DRAFT_501290 [Immersiella caudata]|uniref:Uncharacterized protein n=1 Tax=Immersiella caudata TaxID=314043 RepID=A0AA39XC45_9PEZI|nr:hypothetical protein B0T14DRAFT_501290 [Immersiella caudata]
MLLFIALASLALAPFSHAFVPSAPPSVILSHRNIKTPQQWHKLAGRQMTGGPRLAMAIDTTGCMGGKRCAVSSLAASERQMHPPCLSSPLSMTHRLGL